MPINLVDAPKEFKSLSFKRHYIFFTTTLQLFTSAHTRKEFDEVNAKRGRSVQIPEINSEESHILRDTKDSEMRSNPWCLALEEPNAGENRPGIGEEAKPVNRREVLAELFDLLEAYSPRWYTEEHHHRALAALREG
jgi:hypothetical protein